MNDIDKLHIIAELAQDNNCDLEHHDDVFRKAVDAINVPMGVKEDEFISIQTGTLTIFVCEECAESLNDLKDGWILMYCLNCNASQWIYLPLVRGRVKNCNKINWETECPKCLGKEI